MPVFNPHLYDDLLTQPAIVFQQIESGPLRSSLQPPFSSIGIPE
jgi:hypothetical protein